MKRFIRPPLTPASDDPTDWRNRWFNIIYRHDTPPSRAFDLALLGAIMASVAVIMIDSLQPAHQRLGGWLYGIESIFTLLFTAEYVLRTRVVKRPSDYILSSWGLIDLAALSAGYLSLLVPGLQTLVAIRFLRVLRLFSILHMTRYLQESSLLVSALWRSRHKILLFLFTVVSIAVVAGALMFVIEGPENGFDSLPASMYWAIVTMGTVGFGDVVPHTHLGRIVTSILILIGYSILAVPTGIYTAELATNIVERQTEKHAAAFKASQDLPAGAPHTVRTCSACATEGHRRHAHFCFHCGESLPP